MAENIVSNLLDTLKDFFSRSVQWLLLIAIPFAVIASILQSVGVTTLLGKVALIVVFLVGLALGFALGYSDILVVRNIQEVGVKIVAFVIFIAILSGIISFFAAGGLPAAMGEVLTTNVLKEAIMALVNAIVGSLSSIAVWMYSTGLMLGALLGYRYAK